MNRDNNVSNNVTFSATSATNWFAKLRGTSLTPELDAEFRAWLEESPENQREYERCELLWELAEDSDMQAYIEECESLIASRQQAVERAEARGPSAWFGRPVAMMASAATVAAVAALMFFMSPDTYQTAIGEQQLVKLSDGSSVMMNTNSSMVVDFDGSLRRIELERGEAIFTVSHDPSRPFEVTAGNGLTRAIGTRFNVEIDGQQVTVSVEEGIVEVEVADGQNQGAEAKTAPRLGMGNAINYWDSGVVTDIFAADLERIESWREGKLSFDSTQLAEVVREHNKYNKHRIVIGDDRLKTILVSGVFRIDDTNSLLFALEQTFGIRAKIRGNIILLQASDEA